MIGHYRGYKLSARRVPPDWIEFEIVRISDGYVASYGNQRGPEWTIPKVMADLRWDVEHELAKPNPWGEDESQSA